VDRTVLLAAPLVLLVGRAGVAVHLQPVAVGVGEVQRLADPVIDRRDVDAVLDEAVVEIDGVLYVSDFHSDYCDSLPPGCHSSWVPVRELPVHVTWS